jgi:WD40-like Beta Propeller Repeat
LTIVIVASCAVLVVISYLMLDVLSGLVITPKTPVREIASAGELAIPLPGRKISSMQASSDGRYLAYVDRGAEGGEATLNVIELSRGLPPVFSKTVMGEGLAWLGMGHSLLYADGGDIHRLNVEVGETFNLTASEALDTEPLPSPDGRYILWTRAPSALEYGKAEFWTMNPDGSGQAPLATRADLATWDPVGDTVISLREIDVSAAEENIRYNLQTAVLGEGGWEYFLQCDGEALFLWWPRQDTPFYISPQEVKGQDTIKGTWIMIQDTENPKKVASTDGLGSDTAYYRFYPSREGARLAYVGEKGLEYFDYDERIIYRYPSLRPEGPLAWNEMTGEIYYPGAEGIYRVSLGEE